jgi:hypothetical protein
MVLLGRTLLAIGVLVLAIGGYLLWFLYGGWPAPEGYSFPRHSMLGGPQALFEGSLEDVDGCIRTAGEGSFAVVWPPGYSLSIDDGKPVIHGGFRDVGMGDEVRMGGGYYEDGAPPPGTRDVGACSPPYFLSTGFTD